MFLRKVIEALFLAAGGFDGFVVGLDDVCFVDDAGEALGFGVFHYGNADPNEFFNDFKALVEVCIFGQDMLGLGGQIGRGLVGTGFQGVPRAGEGDDAQ